MKKGMKRYISMLPVDDFISLGEGATPVVEIPRLAEEIGIRNLYVKCEFQNPTGSHKDRMNPLIVTRAKEMGYSKIVAASSGNEGISLACYAAANEISCSIVVTDAIASHWKKAIETTGAELIIAKDSMSRWKLIREEMETENWFSATNVNVPPVGSCCFGVQGYKTISYEIFEEMKDDIPEYILIPTSRGDLLWGIYEGFQDLIDAEKIKEMPRLVAVEPFPRLEKVRSLDECIKQFEGNSQNTPSIGGNTVTVQSYLALKNSNGYAISVPASYVGISVSELARNGLYLETSSALSVAGLKKLVKEKKITENSKALLIATSYGFKN
ncbi:pyridoxal-phosphate dependent enzyme [Bariatricus sp. SGI.161]|uniref:pyridoxal-phosphate dependent enzyme n=1 Tax=Lachnospiraceae TaxID=186803 RepID=UPI00305A779F|nr:pyridoxal-phosphate dependent enzyme [Lachnospiraceae bacterium]